MLNFQILANLKNEKNIFLNGEKVSAHIERTYYVLCPNILLMIK